MKWRPNKASEVLVLVLISISIFVSISPDQLMRKSKIKIKTKNGGSNTIHSFSVIPRFLRFNFLRFK
jgi:hypothetical protein